MTCEKIVATLEKLYSKRADLDKQILEAEKKLLAEVKTCCKPAAVAKPIAKKPVGKKPGPKKPAKK